MALRQNLRQMLLDKLLPGTVVWGSRLVDYEETEHEVHMTLTSSQNKTRQAEQDSIVHCDVLVGADGIRSRVRALRDHKLFGHARGP